MGIEPTYQLVTGTSGLKPGKPTRCLSAPLWPFIDQIYRAQVLRDPRSCQEKRASTMPKRDEPARQVYLKIETILPGRFVSQNAQGRNDAGGCVWYAPAMRLVGIDCGGTFTDFILFDGRQVRTYKVLSTPDDPSRAVLDGLEELGALGVEVVHGSTVATNALLERKGAKVTLVTTKGFEDLLEIGRQNRGALYDLGWTRPEPLIPRSRRIGVRERIDANGRVIEPLDRAALKKVKGKNVAICFLHSYANGRHEREAAKVLKGAVLSSEVLPEFREVERLTTTVIQAYVKPVVEQYVRRLGKAIGKFRMICTPVGMR